MKEKEFKVFCKMLNLRTGKIGDDQPIEETIKNLEGYIELFFKDKGIPEQCQELRRTFESESLDGKSKEEQKDKLLDRLIQLEYIYCKENAKNIIIRNKRIRTGEKVVSITEVDEEAEEFRKKLEAYYRTYKGEVESVEEILQTPMNKFMERQEELGQMATEGVPTIERLKQQQFHNIINSRKKNFTGAPYRWAANLREIETKERLKSLCLMNEPNEKGERVVAMRLGLFEYDKLMRKPSAQFSTGQYGEIRRRGYFWGGEIGCE